VPADALEELRRRFIVAEHVGEMCLLAANELEHTDAAPPAHAEWKRTGELAFAPYDPKIELGILAVVRPPRSKPRVQQERARARPRAHERVPLKRIHLLETRALDGHPRSSPNDSSTSGRNRSGIEPSGRA